MAAWKQWRCYTDCTVQYSIHNAAPRQPPRKLLDLFLIRYLRRPSRSLSTLVLVKTYYREAVNQKGPKKWKDSIRGGMGSALKIKKSTIQNVEFSSFSQIQMKLICNGVFLTHSLISLTYYSCLSELPTISILIRREPLLSKRDHLVQFQLRIESEAHGNQFQLGSEGQESRS